MNELDFLNELDNTPLDDIIDTIVLNNYDSILENDNTIGEDEDYFYNFYGTERY